MNINDKPCNICGDEKRFANTSWCHSCYRNREKGKKDAKKIKAEKREESNEKTFCDIKKILHDKVWRLMSEWIRSKDADPHGRTSCYTCGAVDFYKKMEAGHFRHRKLDFDERNLKCQCKNCNRNRSGNLDVYEEKLIIDHGEEWVEKLIADAWAHNGYSIEELKEIEEDLKQKLEERNQ